MREEMNDDRAVVKVGERWVVIGMVRAMEMGRWERRGRDCRSRLKSRWLGEAKTQPTQHKKTAALSKTNYRTS